MAANDDGRVKDQTDEHSAGLYKRRDLMHSISVYFIS